MSSTITVTTPPLPFDLVSMYEELSVVPRVDIVNIATQAFLTQNQKPSTATPVSQGASDTNEPGSDNIDTQGASLATGALLKLLYGNIDTGKWSPERLRHQRDKILAGETAVALGQALYTALSLDPDRLQAGPALFSQLTWCALLFELEPPRQRRYSHMAGLDLCSPNMMGKKLRRELVRHLKSKARTADGLRSTDEARLAVSLLEPLYPELARNDLPSTLYCGSLAWSNLTHAIALSEALRPGSSLEMDRQQLENRLLEASQTTDEEELSIIAAACIRPALHWAVMQGKVAHREDGNYSEADLVHAQATLDVRRNSAARAVDMLFSNMPDRLEMARQKLREAYADTDFLRNYKPEWPLTPTTLGKKLKYLAHGHVDWKSDGRTRFNMLELFTSGHTIKGTEDFSADPIENKTFGGYFIAPDLDKLRGIDLPALFDEAFDKHWEYAKAGYESLIQTLFEQLPSAEREVMKRSAVGVFALRDQQTFPAKDETAHERELLRGRMGFVIQCVDPSYPGRKPVSYEVFPLQARMIRRTDLNRFPFSDMTKDNKDARLSMTVDWQAYRDGRDPLPGQTANLVPLLLHAFGPAEELLRNLRQTSSKIADQHMYFYRDQLYSQQRGKTFVEEIDDAFPTALAAWSVLVPGLGCYNALKTNKHLAITVSTCALDIASVLLLPAVRLGAGVVGLTRLGGQITVGARLSALADLTGKFVKASTVSYVTALNPVQMLMPVYWGGRLLYKGGSRGILALSRLRNRITAPRFRRTFTLPSAKSPTENQIRNATDLDDFLEKNKVFGSSESLRRQRREGVLALLEEGVDVRIYTRPNGTKTLVAPDEITSRQVTYVDLVTNATVNMGGYYNYRQLRSWKPVADASDSAIINVPVGQITSTRSALEADRLTSVKTAIEEGVPLPALDVIRTSRSYSIVNGSHRLQAAKDLSLETVPVKVATAGQTTAVAASQLGYTANYGLHFRGLLVVPAVLGQTPPKHGPGQTPPEPEVPHDHISEEQRARLRDIDFAGLLRSTWVT